MDKVEYPIDKREWHPSLIPGVVVLISTYGPGMEPNIAPKSWVQMVSFDPPMLMFSGTKANVTERNVMERGCFGVNFVDWAMMPRIYESLHLHGRERIAKAGFTMEKSRKIVAPLVSECRAHLECVLRDTKEMGSGFVVFGEIVASSIWDGILRESPQDRYQLLDLTVFLEDGLFSRIGDVSAFRLGGGIDR